jgi:uncharacterized protein YbbC (DUF1343 family)
MNKQIIILLTLFLLSFLDAFATENTTKRDSVIQTGADQYNRYLKLLEGKKIGIVTNQTAIINLRSDNETIHLIDFLLQKNISIQTIFAPEHGFRGVSDAGETVVDGKDFKTGLPIISLYGENKKPTTEQLQNIDLIIFDIQDVGVRFYTYISSLHYVMEACAENRIPLLILDRPNPNANVVDGPVLEMNLSSFVGMHPVPVLHGMTIGEYALMINGEKWLKNGVQCDLTVIPCAFYNHKMNYSLPIRPSPNLPNDRAINLYASLCLFEGTNVSVGRGTEKQFQVYGSPFMDKSNFKFVPQPNLGAKNPLYNGIVCYGKNLSNRHKINRFELKWLKKAYRKTADKATFFNAFFTKLAGTTQLQLQIETGVPIRKIRKSWQKELLAFKIKRQKYLLY